MAYEQLIKVSTMLISNRKALTLCALLTSLSFASWADTPSLLPGQDMHPPGAKVDIDEDQDEVLEAVREGKIRPFSELYQTVAQQLNGRVIKVELEEDDDMWVYELKIVYQNSVYKVEYNARDLSIFSIRGRNVMELIKRQR